MMLQTNLQSIQISIYPDGRLDAKNAASYLGLKEKTLAMMRGNGTGPRFIKRGHIFYFKEDLDAWLNANGRLISTAQGLKSTHKGGDL
jgi:hypothetical protein